MERVCVISGGSSGIGLSTARELSKKGYHVVIFDIQKPEESYEYYYCDLMSYQSIEKAVSQVLRKHKDIPYLFSNAGIHLSANIEQTNLDDISNVININLRGTLYLLKAIIPHMREARFGRIVLNSSDQAFVGKKNSAVYGATKAGIAQLAKSMSLDYCKFDIRVNAICPGTVDTPLYRSAINKYAQENLIDVQDLHAAESSLQPVNRIGTPNEIAQCVLFLFSDAANYITGINLPIDGGYVSQ